MIYYHNIQRIKCDLLSQYTKDKDYNNIQRIRCDLLSQYTKDKDYHNIQRIRIITIYKG